MAAKRLSVNSSIEFKVPFLIGVAGGTASGKVSIMLFLMYIFRGTNKDPYRIARNNISIERVGILLDNFKLNVFNNIAFFQIVN